MSLAEMSVAGGAVILAVTVIRALGMNRLPKAMFTVLWAVALARLLVPVSIPSAVSIYRWAGMSAVRAETAEAVREELPAAQSAAEGPVYVPAAETVQGTGSPAERTAPVSPGRRSSGRQAFWAAAAFLPGPMSAAAGSSGRRWPWRTVLSGAGRRVIPWAGGCRCACPGGWTRP